MAKRKIKEVLPPLHCSSVKEYEQSPWWINKSKALLDNKECKCPICGRSRWKWQVRNKVWKRDRRFCTHHISYINVPNEKEEDLIVLCWQCHDLCHQILRLEKLGSIYFELAQVVKKYFKYDKISTFNKW